MKREVILIHRMRLLNRLSFKHIDHIDMFKRIIKLQLQTTEELEKRLRMRRLFQLSKQLN